MKTLLLTILLTTSTCTLADYHLNYQFMQDNQRNEALRIQEDQRRDQRYQQIQSNLHQQAQEERQRQQYRSRQRNCRYSNQTGC